MNDKELMTSERRAADIQQVLGEINRFLDLHPHVLHKEGPGKNIFFAHGCKDNVTGDFTVWVIKNREPVELHFLEDYFDPIERQQIYSRLEPLVMPNPPDEAFEFFKNLGRLFIYLDMMEGYVTTEPWSRAMYKTGRRPARHYKPIIATRVGVEWVINEDADAAIRGKKLTEIIEALIVHFPPERREFWRKSFQHIADGGSGAAPQLHAGKTLTQAQWNETAEAIKGRSQAGAAIKTDMSERGFKKRLAKRKGGRIVQKKG